MHKKYLKIGKTRMVSNTVEIPISDGFLKLQTVRPSFEISQKELEKAIDEFKNRR
ncbi:MAG: hypothetical protein P8X74_03900 [Reinekea sp.]